MTSKVPHFINGKPSQSIHDHGQEIYNPASGEVSGWVGFANTQEVEQAVAAAKNAFPSWSAMPALKRARILFKLKELLEKNLDELAVIITREHGKILEDAKGSVLRAIELVEYYCGVPNLLKGTYSENVSIGIDNYTIRQPLGVCVGVSPFNFPVMVPIWMMVPAIACGNTFILKPSEKDPSASIKLAELFKQAGLPDGVFNVIQGDKSAVLQLITHADVAAVTCVGSTQVAEHIYRTAVAHGKRAHTFGGAKNHGLVMPDADLEVATDAIIGAAYGSAGERCMAISAVIAVGDEVANRLVGGLQQKLANLKVGPGHDPQSEMGPLITRAHWQRVQQYVQIGIEEGAHLVIDGRQISVPGYEQGFFMGPCLFDQVKPLMRIYREEIFGPILVLLRATHFDQALQWVNEHEYGNGAAIFTRDGGVARTFATEAQVGMIGINVPIPVPAAYHSFGGWKRSWFGDLHMHAESLAFYTKPKTISSRWPHRAEGPGYHLPVH